MSRQPQIRWRESDLQELKRVVKNFNAKLARIEKKNPAIKNYLPKFAKEVENEYGEKLVEFTDRLSVNQLIDMIHTRQDLNRELNALKRFSKRGAETIIDAPDTDYNIKLTKWQKEEMNRRLYHVNKRREKRLEDIKNFEMTAGGHLLGYTREDIGMGKLAERQLSPIEPFTPKMTQTSLRWKWYSILSESQTDYYINRDKEVRANYIKGIKQSYNPEDPKIKAVIKRIEKMDIKEFFKVFEKEGGTFEFASPDPRPSHKTDEYYGYRDRLFSTWLPSMKPQSLNDENNNKNVVRYSAKKKK
jgi:hypothetical protein